jgi:hypothetical protein
MFIKVCIKENAPDLWIDSKYLIAGTQLIVDRTQSVLTVLQEVKGNRIGIDKSSFELITTKADVIKGDILWLNKKMALHVQEVEAVASYKNTFTTSPNIGEMKVRVDGPDVRYEIIKSLLATGKYRCSDELIYEAKCLLRWINNEPTIML